MNDVKTIKELVELLNKASEAYYKYDNPIMSDKQFDDLYGKLAALENKTGIILNNSPTQKCWRRNYTRTKRRYNIQDRCFLQTKQKIFQK